MKRTYSDEELFDAVRESTTMADVLRKLNLVPKGGNYSIRSRIRKLGLDTSHWLGRAHLRGKTRRLPKLPLSEILVDGSTYGRTHLKERLLKEGLLNNWCSLCGQDSVWRAGVLVLILDHINGKNTDNRLENLRLLCPNCNSQQDTFCGRKNRGVKRVEHIWKCEDCGTTITRDARWCRPCGRKRTRKVERPSLDALLQDRQNMSMEAVGRKYGVSGNAVKKWIRQAQVV